MKTKTIATKEINYFKRHQRDGIYNYYEVHGGPGRTINGKKIMLCFLNDVPLIAVEHNYVADTSGLTGTWCEFEVGVPISKEEYQTQYKKASEHPDVKIY